MNEQIKKTYEKFKKRKAIIGSMTNREKDYFNKTGVVKKIRKNVNKELMK